MRLGHHQVYGVIGSSSAPRIKSSKAPEFDNFMPSQKFWTPVFTGVTLFTRPSHIESQIIKKAKILESSIVNGK
jgi:hypothetical protein